MAPLCSVRCSLKTTLSARFTGSTGTPVPMKIGIVVMNSCCNSPTLAKQAAVLPPPTSQTFLPFAAYLALAAMAPASPRRKVISKLAGADRFRLLMTKAGTSW